MPVYNEPATAAIAPSSGCWTCRLSVRDRAGHRRRRQHRRHHARCYASIRTRRAGCRVTRCTPATAARVPAIRTAAGLAAGDYIILDGRRPRVRPGGDPAAARPGALTGEATVVYGTRTFSSNNAYSFLVRAGQQGRHDGGERAVQLLPERPGDLLQADAAAPLPGSSTSARRGSAWRPRSPASCCAAGCARSRCRSATPPAPANEGKKLTWRDGVEALRILLRERLRPPVRL